MTTDTLARQLDAGFVEGRHHPVPVIAPPNSFYDDPPEATGESATQAFAVWIKSCTHQGEALRHKDEIAVRIVGLIYLLDRGEKPIAQLAFEAGVPRSTLHRCIKVISAKTGLKVPHQKKARSSSKERAVKQSVNHVRDDHRYA